MFLLNLKFDHSAMDHFNNLEPEPLIYNIVPQTEDVDSKVCFEMQSDFQGTGIVSTAEEVEVKIEVNSSSDVSDNESLEPEPMVYEFDKKKQRRKTQVLVLSDPLKEELEDSKIIEQSYSTDSDCMYPGFSNEDTQDDTSLGDIKVQDISESKPSLMGTEIKLEVADSVLKNSKICNLCNLVFISSKLLKHHRQKEHKIYGKAYKITCNFCQAKFKKEIDLEKHSSKKHSTQTRASGAVDIVTLQKMDSLPIGELVCSICTLLFTNYHRLKFHMRRKHNTNVDLFPHKCGICDLSYDKLESLNKHFKRKHCIEKPPRKSNVKRDGTENVLDCQICGMIYTTSFSLNKHMRWAHDVVTGEVNYFCQSCGKGFASKRTLQSHVSKNHVTTKYICVVCGAQFKLKDSFRRHVSRKHSILNGNSHLCCQCGETFDSEDNLSKHITEAHTNKSKRHASFDTNAKIDFDANVKESVVLNQDKMPSSRMNLQKPPEELLLPNRICSQEFKKDCNPTCTETYNCKQCNFKGLLWKELARHVKRIHLQMKPKRPAEKTPCQFCGLVLKRNGLTKHIQGQHKSGVQTRTRRCLSENSDCFRSAHLNKSTDSSEDSLLCCRKCSFKTVNIQFMKDHEKSQHSSTVLDSLNHYRKKLPLDKKYKCSRCNFITKYSSSLKYHINKKHHILTDHLFKQAAASLTNP